MKTKSQDVFDCAVSLFGAFAAGVASKDVHDGRMSRDAADRWKKDAIQSFSDSLKRMAQLS